MNPDVLAKLRRLGVVKGTQNLKVGDQGLGIGDRRPETSNQPPTANGQRLTASDQPLTTNHQPLTTLIPGGYELDTPEGPCFVVDRVYPLAYEHGGIVLGELLGFAPAGSHPYFHTEDLTNHTYRDFVFLDIETDGLGGAGAIACMIGLAYFEDNALIIRQLFARDHAEEVALLHIFQETMADKIGLISFNGRGFDLPFLENRFIINRQFVDTEQWPHLDLMMPSRRLWHRRFGKYNLRSLERNVLGFEREEHLDIESWEIPYRYHRYLQEGNTTGLLPVFDHHHQDMISMVTLLVKILRVVSRPGNHHPLEHLGLALWQLKLGLTDQAEANLRLSAVPDMPTEQYHHALSQLGLLLKRAKRRDEALAVWQQIAFTSLDDVDAHVELAKHFEWHASDIYQAINWTTQAIALTERWLPSQKTTKIQAELQHRLNRLARKMGGEDA